MAAVPVVIYEGTLSATLTTVLNTVPTGKTWVITSIVAANGSGTIRSLTLKVNGVTKFAAEPIGINGRLCLGPDDIRWVVAATHTITGGASAGSAIELAIYGVEI